MINKKTGRITLFIAAILLMVILFWNFLSRDKEDMSELWERQFSHIKADLTLEDVQYSRFSKNGGQYMVNASRARLYEDRDRMDLDNIIITFFKKNNEKVVIVADAGNFDRKKNIFSVHKNVIVNFAHDERLYASILNYNQDSQVIWSDKPVTLKREDGLRINGRSMEYQVDKGLLILKDQESLIPSSGLDQG